MLLFLLKLSPYGADENQLSPSSSHGSNHSSTSSHSPTLASIQMDPFYGSSPQSQFLGTSPSSSANMGHVGGHGEMNNSNNYGEPPHKIFPEIAFEDLSASFKNLYKSVFEASQSGTTSFGKGKK